LPPESLLEYPKTQTETAEVGSFLTVAAAGTDQTAQLTRKNWFSVLVKFASVQVVVQILGFIAGIMIVRALPKRQYAFYTIGNTMLASILILADSGISSALSAIGGRVWQDQRGLGSLLNTALQLRRQMALFTVIAVVPISVWLLRQNGAHPFETALLVAAVLVGSSLELITRIYSIALRLKSEVRQIQTQALLAALTKLAIVGAAIFFAFNALVAILSVVAGYAVQFYMLRTWTRKNIDTHAPSESTMRSEIVGVIRKQAPHSIYYCLQGQIAIWLIGLFGNADNVANVGALGRLGMVFAVLSSVMCELVLPAFARIQSSRRIRRRYIQIVLGYFAISAALITAIASFPDQTFAILGSQYGGLHMEGILMAISVVAGSMAGLLWAVNAARAWIVPPQLLIPCTILLQCGLAWTLKLSTVRGVLLFSLYTWVPSILLSVWFAVKKMREFESIVA
jgi:O-antigen/teichoic acid export membrane protein